MKIGDRIRVQRDEKLYPSRGTWSRYRGRVGTVCRSNKADDEWGVLFSADATPQTGGTVTWFKPYELVVIDEIRFQADVDQGPRTAPTATA